MSSKKEEKREEKKEENIYDEYFRLTQQYAQEYGPNTIVLLQVGKFFEMYGLIMAKGGEIQGSIVKEVCEVCDLKMSNPAIGISANPTTQQHVRIMAGFQICYLEKYLQILTDAGYTSVVYVEDKMGAEGANTKKKINRILYNIYSAGTYIPIEETTDPKLTNNIVCIWFETYAPLKRPSINTQMVPTNAKKYTQLLITGISAINVYSGKANIFEYETEYYNNPTTFDELERFISMFNPSEVIIISDFTREILNNIIQYTNIKTNMIHFIQKNTNVSKDVKFHKNGATQKVENCMKQTYINHILSKYYGEECTSICKEFDHYPIATQSFCFLLDFVNTHCPDLVKKIDIPLFNNTSDRVILANHTLKQLNIIDDMTIDAKKCGKLSSVYSFLNKCCTSMGKRRFQTTFLMPVFNEEWLETEYTMVSHMLSPKNASLIPNFRKIMGQIKDIERISRQLIMRKVAPNTIYQLYESLKCIQNINVCLFEAPELMDYLVSPVSKEKNGYNYIDELIQMISFYMESQLNIHLCQGESSLEKYTSIIIKRGVSSELDALTDKYSSQLQFIEDCKLFFNHIMCVSEKSPDGDFVKKHETEKGGIALQMTNKRGQTLKRALEQSYPQSLTITSGGMNYPITTATIKMTASTTSMCEITFPKLELAIKEVYKIKTEINEKMTELYQLFLVSLENKFGNSIHQLNEYICKLDVLVCKAYIAKEYKYCRPNINANAEKSYVDVKELRHVLIEHIQQNELYVTNDILVGTPTCSGILLYGTNAVGKTSIIRALGISVIMAQAGMYVPATEFTYKPYTAIYSRILGNDNLFKGLSTFAVEMSELRVILNNADQNSLVLGDELCSGTESESALSIFVAGLLELHKRQTTFLFATHFHEITTYDEIKELRSLKCMHLAVYYDKENDCLVYDRKLKEGSGTRMYGLEVCKSLYLPADFLEKAYELRAKYHPVVQGELSYKTSSYNAKKIRGLCEMCKVEMSEETHHLQEQQMADGEGYIGSFHKNHSANLLCVCAKCHDKIHYGNGQKNSEKNENTNTVLDNHIISKTEKGGKVEEKVEKNELPVKISPKKLIVKKKTTKGIIVMEEK